MTNFPTYIQIDLNGYGEQYIPNLYFSEFESGPSKRRRRSTKTQKIVSFTGFICGIEKYQQFVSWWRLDIAQGSDWFAFTDPMDLVAKRARMLNDSLDAQPLQIATNEGLAKWQVNFEIEVYE